MKPILMPFCSVCCYMKPILLLSCSLFCYSLRISKNGAGRVPLCGLNNVFFLFACAERRIWIKNVRVVYPLCRVATRLRQMLTKRSLINRPTDACNASGVANPSCLARAGLPTPSVFTSLPMGQGGGPVSPTIYNPARVRIVDAHSSAR